MHNTAVFADARVKRNHLDAARHRLFANRDQCILIIGRNGDGIDLLRNERVNHSDLLFSSGLGRAGVDDLDIAEFFGGFHAAIAHGIKEADAESLHHQRHADFISGKGGGNNTGGQSRCGHQLDEFTT